MKYFWHQATLVRIAIPLIAGIVLGFYLPPSFLFRALSGFLVIVITALYFLLGQKWKYYKNRYWVGAIFNLGFLFAGVFLSVGKNEELVSSLELPPVSDYYSAQLLDFPHSGENSVRLDLSIQSFSNGRGYIACKAARIFAYTPPDLRLDTLKPGDQVFFSAALSRKAEVLNPGQFDYSRYLQNKGVAATTYISDGISVTRPDSLPFQFSFAFQNIQTYCVGIFSHFNIPARELGVASALVFGKRTLIDPNLKSEYSEVGAVHILAVSGLHVGIIYVVIVTLLGRIFKSKKWRPLILIISLFFLWTYAGITGFSPSVMRATVMFSFIAVGKLTDQRANIYNMLAASAIVLVVCDPAFVKEVGFQLSYMAVLGISYFYKPMYQLRVFKYWLPDKIWSLLVVAVAAQISTFPLSIYYFGQFPNYFLPTNIIVIPAAMIALYSGLLLLVFHWIPFIGDIFAWFLQWDLWVLNTFIEWVASLPMALSDHLHLSILAVILLYLSIIYSAMVLRFPSKRNLVVVCGIFIALTAMWNYRKMNISNRVELSVLKANNGDAICLQKGRLAYILLADTSKSGIVKSRFYLDGYFDKKGIDREVWIPFETDFRENEIVGKKGFYSFDSLRFSLPNNDAELDIANAMTCDFVLIGNEMKLLDSQLENPKIIYVLSSNLAPWKRDKIIVRLDSLGVQYWDMQSQGVFLL